MNMGIRLQTHVYLPVGSAVPERRELWGGLGSTLSRPFEDNPAGLALSVNRVVETVDVRIGDDRVLAGERLDISVRPVSAGLVRWHDVAFIAGAGEPSERPRLVEERWIVLRRIGLPTDVAVWVILTEDGGPGHGVRRLEARAYLLPSDRYTRLADSWPTEPVAYDELRRQLLAGTVAYTRLVEQEDAWSIVDDEPEDDRRGSRETRQVETPVSGPAWDTRMAELGRRLAASGLHIAGLAPLGAVVEVSTTVTPSGPNDVASESETIILLATSRSTGCHVRAEWHGHAVDSDVTEHELVRVAVYTGAIPSWEAAAADPDFGVELRDPTSDTAREWTPRSLAAYSWAYILLGAR